jgi:hypothetical protein
MRQGHLTIRQGTATTCVEQGNKERREPGHRVGVPAPGLACLEPAELSRSIPDNREKGSGSLVAHDRARRSRDPVFPIPPPRCRQDPTSRLQLVGADSWKTPSLCRSARDEVPRPPTAICSSMKGSFPATSRFIPEHCRMHAFPLSADQELSCCQTATYNSDGRPEAGLPALIIKILYTFSRRWISCLMAAG